MKKKILYWVGTDITPFCIAYNLEKHLDSENYAIIDVTNKPKTFFENQKLVSFSKIWFLHDNLTSIKKPNMKYLQDMEKKYDLNIWKLAINERIFYRFYDYYKFSSDEILSIEESALKFFEKILDEINPTHFITKVPAFHHLELFTQMCKKRGINVLIFGQTNIAKKCIISNEASKFEIPFNYVTYDTHKITFENLREKYSASKLSNQIKNLIQNNRNHTDFFKALLKFIFNSNDNIHSHYNYFGRTKTKVLFYQLKLTLQGKYRNHYLDTHLIKKIDFNFPFLYFPLAVDLERNLLINAPYFTNQIELIRTIAKSTPVGYHLIVKESPAQITRAWRPISEYKEIMDIPNVILLHPDVQSDEIYKKCKLVITVTGSSGLEASLYGIPSLIFADTFYSELPSVTRVKEITALPYLIKKSLEHNVNPDIINQYLDFVDKITFNFDLFAFNTIYKNAFYLGGILVDVEISEKQMKSFLIKNENFLEPLVTAFLKKIQNNNFLNL